MFQNLKVLWLWSKIYQCKHYESFEKQPYCARPPHYTSRIHSWTFYSLLVSAYLATSTPSQGFPAWATQALSVCGSINLVSLLCSCISIFSGSETRKLRFLTIQLLFWPSLLMFAFDKHFCHLPSFIPPQCKPSCSGYFIIPHLKESIWPSRKLLPY